MYSLPNYKVGKMCPWVMFFFFFYFSWDFLRIFHYSRISSSHKATAIQISIFQCVYTLMVWLSCWHRLTQCFIWPTSCYVMASIALIISLQLLSSAVKSYLYFTLPPNQGPSLFCEKVKVTWVFWQLQFLWGCWFLPEKDVLLSCCCKEKTHLIGQKLGKNSMKISQENKSYWVTLGKLQKEK